jgi:hypothetical protein
MKKTNYGDPVMTYPFSHEVSPVGGNFIGLEYDGANFWSLEKITYGGSNEKRRRLRRWRIESHMLVLKDSWILFGQGGENINNDAFTIEHYHDVLGSSASPTDVQIYLNTPTACYFHSGDAITLYDPSTGVTEDVAAQGHTGNYQINLQTQLDNSFSAGSKVSHFRDLYFFNNQAPTIGASSAAVYQWSIPITIGDDPTQDRTPIYIGCHESGIYEDVKAAHFCTVSGIEAINDGYHTGSIIYIRGMQMLFKKPSRPPGTTGYPDGEAGTGTEHRENFASMLIDTLMKTDKSSIHTVYDLSSSATPGTENALNIYRLQNAYTYTADGTWSTYNYVVSVMEPMITSLTLVIEPAVLSANGTDDAHVYATLRDQYDYPMNDKTVTFQVSGPLGGKFKAPTVTDTPCTGGCCWIDPADYLSAQVVTGCQNNIDDGMVVIGWLVGTTAGFPIITATVQQ